MPMHGMHAYISDVADKGIIMMNWICGIRHTLRSYGLRL